MAIIGRFTKQPGDTLDYQFDYTKWLADRADTAAGLPTVTAAVHSAPLGSSPPALTITNVVINAGVVSFFASGGMDGVQYEVTCGVSTTGGRTKFAEILITVKAS